MMEKAANLTDDQYEGLADVAALYDDNLEGMLDVQEGLLTRVSPELAARTGAATTREERRIRAKESLGALRKAIGARDIPGYMEDRRKEVEQAAAAGVPFGLVAESLVTLLDPLGRLIHETYGADHERRLRAGEALGWLKAEMLVMSGQAYAVAREEKIEDKYQKVIRGLSTPVIEVWESILVMPLIGVIDSGRGRQIMEQLLERIVSTQAELVILDVTGVPTVDTEVADHLMRTTRAAGLVGAHTILVGISPQVAQTLVRLGVSLAGIETMADLRSGLERAFSVLGYRMVREA